MSHSSVHTVGVHDGVKKVSVCCLASYSSLRMTFVSYPEYKPVLSRYHRTGFNCMVAF